MVRTPSYITRSQHGVYYFQIRAEKDLKIRLGIKSKLYRRSLKTKDRKIALGLARRLWVELHTDDEDWFNMVDIPKVGTKEFDNWEATWKDAERVKSKSIRVALEVDQQLNKIPKWDFDARESFIESLNPEDHAAMQFVSDNDIDLNKYKDESSLVQNQQTQTSTSGAKSRKLSALLDEYLVDVKSNKAVDRTISLYRDQVSMFIELVTDKASDQLSYEDVNHYKASLLKIPSNRNKKKKYRKVPLEDLLRMDIDPVDLLSESTCSTYVSNVKAFLDWGAERNFIDSEAVSALNKVFKKAKSYPYLPFTEEDLRKLFNSDDYISGKQSKAYQYWIPLIALFTGARSNEICQLSVSDIKSGVPSGPQVDYFDFNDDNYKSLKNESSRRRVPIHGELLELDFLDFVDRQKKRGNSRLFSELKETDGKFNHYFGRWFRGYQDKCGVLTIPPDKRKTFHSFRHTVASKLRNTDGVPIEDIGELIGHSHTGTTLKNYARELDLKQKFDLVQKIKYDVNLKEIRRWRK